MLTNVCVERLLRFLGNKTDRKIKTAIYVAKTADLKGLGKYVRQLLEDESYISRSTYKFDYDESDIFVETTETYQFFKDVIAKNYEMVFMLEGDESKTLQEYVKAAAKHDSTIFWGIDRFLKSYRLLDPYKEPRQLKRRQE